MNFSIRILFCIGLITSSIHATVVIKGNSTDITTTFATAYNDSVFHVPTQTIFFGLDNNAGAYSLTKLSTTTGSCTGIATTTGNTALANTFINNLALSTPANSDQPHIIGTSVANSTTAATSLFATNIAGTIVTTLANPLNDSTGTTATAGIVNVAANSKYAFAAVVSNGAANTTSFGTGANDGIAMVSINPTTLVLTAMNASTGATDNQALTVTTTTAQIVAGTAAVTFNPNYTPAMYWCEPLQRLYIGLQGTTNATNGKMISVLIGEIDADTNALSFLNPVANTYAAINDANRIIGASTGNTAISARKLSVMQTSTGFFYLIVQGGSNIANFNTNNLVFAVPLVHGDGAADGIVGTFAKADLTTNDFAIQATNAGDLFSSINTAAVVGNGGFPGGALVVANAPADAGATQSISSMFVHGDTVFISIESTAPTPQGATVPGIYYSQPIFNNKGKIQSWTQWQKAAPIASGSADGSVHDVFVNALTGHIISTDVAKTIVKTTQWYFDDQNNPNALVNVLNSTFTDGCFSCYVLNDATPNFGANTNRYALFGGYGKILFAYINSAPNTLIQNFLINFSFITTELPNDTAPVTSLGYSKWQHNENRGFFFAGTKNGLYVFANKDTHTAIPSNQFGNLALNPFPTSSWQKVTSVTGEVRKIVNNGGSIYVLTKSVNDAGVPVDTVFQIPSDTTVANIIANTHTIAVSNTGSLVGAPLFFDLGIIPIAQNFSNSYLLLATSNGLYKSTVNIDNENTQNDAGWTQVTTDVTDRIFKSENALYPITNITSSWTSNSTQPKSYNKALLHQLSSSATTNTLVELPTTSYLTSTGTPSVVNSPSLMFNDGTRRFMVMQPDEGNRYNNKLYTLPYLTGSSNWNWANGPWLLQDQFLSSDTVSRYYWIQMMGATGNLYVGTDNGVIALG